jgi:O-antigen ligase
MIRQSIRRSFRPNDLLFSIIVGCSFGLLLGIAFLWFSPLLVLGALTATVFIYATLKRPEVAPLGILIATSSIVFEDQLPMISVGISLHIPDLLLLGSLGLIAVRWLVEREFRIVRTQLDWPLLIFYGLTLLSTFIAVLQSSVEVQEALRATRVLTYYLTFFIVTNLVRERRQLNFLLKGLFLLATIVAAAMVVQFLLGDSIHLLPGRVETLNTQGTLFEDITRILPPGWSIVLVSFVAILCILVLEKFKPLGWLKFLQIGLLGVALLVTFLRSYWAVLIMVFVLLAFLFRGVDRQRLMGWSLVVISSAAIILLLVFGDPGSRATKLVGASMDRLSTLGNSGTFQGQDSSLNWRMIENGYALSTIAAHPWIGLGMGFTYRPWDSRIDQRGPGGSGFDFRKFIHNGHLWILLQSGLLGYLSLMWLSFAFLVRGFRYWRSVADDRLRGVVLGFTLVYLAVLIAAVVNSTFVQWRWTPVIGIIMGINEVILMKSGQEASVA